MNEQQQGQPKRGYEVRCENCGALQFVAAAAWRECSVEHADLCIKCWRRSCKRIIPLQQVTHHDTAC